MVSSGGYDMFLAKYSPQGAHLWSQKFGGTLNDMINGIAVDSQGNVVVTGTFQGTVGVGGVTWNSIYGATDMFIAKYSPQGGHIWSKTFDNDGGDEYAKGIALDGNDNIFITGNFGVWVDFGGGYVIAAGGGDYFVAKFSSVGSYLWAKAYGGTGGQLACAVAVDAAGDAVVTGGFDLQIDAGGGVISTQHNDIFVAKYSGVNGSYQWLKTLGGLGTHGVCDLATDGQRNITLTGYFDSSGLNF